MSSRKFLKDSLCNRYIRKKRKICGAVFREVENYARGRAKQRQTERGVLSMLRVIASRSQVALSRHADFIEERLRARWAGERVYETLCREFGPGYPHSLTNEQLWEGYEIPSAKSITRYAARMRTLERLGVDKGTPRVLFFAWRDVGTGKWKMWIALNEGEEPAPGV